MYGTPRNIHTKFGSNWAGGVGGEDFWNIIQNSKKNVEKGQYLQHDLTYQNENLTTDRSHHAENFYPMSESG